MNEVAAIVLAAGRSERMGAFKPLLPFGQSTVIESCIEKLTLGGVDQVTVVVGHRANDIEKHLRSLTVDFVRNPEPESEMSVSIACGVHHLELSVQAVLIALCDQPSIPGAVVRSLITQWRQGAKIVKPEYGGRGGHPVLIDLRFRNELMNLDPQGGLRSFFVAHAAEVCRLAVDTPMIARDMDQWDDYLKLHQEVFGFGPNQTSRRPN